MSNPQTYLFDLPAARRPQDAQIPEIWYPGVQEHWPHVTSQRQADPILDIRALVIHATAGSSSTGAMSVMKAHKASWHWLVPDENEEQHGKLVWACAPEARAAWHVRNAASHPKVNGGRTHVNHWSLGIEIVNAQPKKTAPPDAFSDWQVAITARIVRYCWAKYPNLTQVVSHAVLDPTRRSDPGEAFPWADFRDSVLSQADDLAADPLVLAATPMHALSADAGTDLCCRVA